MHNQVIELLSNYGKIDYFFFDGAWPRTASELGSIDLVKKMRELQPGILINNRLGKVVEGDAAKLSKDGGLGAGESSTLGDFGTPEREIVADSKRVWESCQVPNWRLWGFCKGERWFSSAQILDMLCECAEKGGNLLLNVCPDGDGRIPDEFCKIADDIGNWIDIHGEAIYGTTGGNISEFCTFGRQTVKNNVLYLIIRFWHGERVMRVPDIVSNVKSVKLMTTDKDLEFYKKDDYDDEDDLDDEEDDSDEDDSDEDLDEEDESFEEEFDGEFDGEFTALSAGVDFSSAKGMNGEMASNSNEDSQNSMDLSPKAGNPIGVLLLSLLFLIVIPLRNR